jgi:hypothetical protein
MFVFKFTNGIMKKFTLLLLLFSILSCETPDRASNVAVEKLRAENDSLQQQIDSLNTTLKELRSTENYWFANENEGATFIEKGINDPKTSIEKALREKPELIPLEAVLGGTMRFGNIEILSDKWVIADYDDGHVTGKSIYRYQLTPNKTFAFELVDSKGPE